MALALALALALARPLPLPLPHVALADPSGEQSDPTEEEPSDPSVGSSCRGGSG